MANFTLTSEPPLAGYDKTIRDVRVKAPKDLALVSIALPLRAEDKALKAIKKAYGVDLPDVGSAATSKDRAYRLLRMAQDQAFVMFTHTTPDAADVVSKQLNGTAYVTDQTDVWTALDISGAAARAALERICPIDLHPDAFMINAVARTIMEHLGVVVLRTDEDTYTLLSASSSAGSFLHAVETSAQNVG